MALEVGIVGLPSSGKSMLFQALTGSRAAGVAGGLLANSLVAGASGGVADFVHAGGWIYSPGDLAVIGGTVLLALGTATAALRMG